MPANKNAMTRYKILDELLSNRYHNYSLDDLTEKVSNRLAEIDPNTNGVVRRTIEKDLKYLEEEGPFLVDIEHYSVSAYNWEEQKSYTKQCLRYRSPSFSIFKKEMTEDEEYLLREALSILGQFDGLPNLEALEKLRLGLGGKKEERQIISFIRNPLENSNLLGVLFTAISQCLVVQLDYHRFSNPTEIKTINVHPYLLKEYNHRWFLMCQAEAGSKILCFSLDRIDKVTPMPSHKYMNYEKDINEIFEDIIGVTLLDESPLYHIVFWVSNVSKDYVLTKPLHGSQIHIKGEKADNLCKYYPMQEGAFFSIDCKYNYELERELASFGKELLVLEPSEVQDKIWNRIQAMNENYQKLRTLRSL